MLPFNIVLTKGRVDGCGYGNVDGGDDGCDTNYGEGGRLKRQQQSDRWTADDQDDVATMSVGGVEEEEGRMGPRRYNNRRECLAIIMVLGANIIITQPKFMANMVIT